MWQSGVLGEGDDKGARSAALSAENARRDHRTLAPWRGPLVRQRREGRYPCWRHRKAHRRIPLGWQTASSRTTACTHKSERRDPLGLRVHFAPNSGAKADIPGPLLWAIN